MRPGLSKLYRNWTEGRRSPGLFCFGALARPISWVYGAEANRRLKNRVHLPQPTNARLVVVSSPLVGGTGKTPLAGHIASAFARQGETVAIVTLGYGQRPANTDQRPGSAPAVGDEGEVHRMTTGLPVHAGARPEEIIAELDRQGATSTIVFDDGISRAWLDERRINVLTSRDCPAPVRYVPYGRWRVGPAFLTGSNAVAIVDEDAQDEAVRLQQRTTLRGWGFDGPIAWFQTQLDTFSRWTGNGREPLVRTPEGKPLLVSGLAQPVRLRRFLERESLPVAAEIAFPDHHAYTPADAQQIIRQAERQGCNWVLTTLKDAVKIDPHWLGSLPICIVEMKLEQYAGENLIALLTAPVQ